MLDDIQRGQSRGRSERAFFMGVVTERPIGDEVKIGAGNDAGQRHDATAKALPDHQDIGDDLELLAHEHGPGPTQTARDLVENQ